MKHMIILVIIIAIIAVKSAYPQEVIWLNHYGSPDYDYESARNVLPTYDDGFMIVGNSGVDWYTSGLTFLKISTDGDSTWMKRDESAYRAANGSDFTYDNGFIIVGTYPSEDYPPDGYYLKADQAGNIIWERSLPITGVSSVEETADSGFIIAGYDGDYIVDQWVFVMKTDSLGAGEWTKTLKVGGSGDELNYANCVRQTADGGYIICGGKGGTLYPYRWMDMFLLRLNFAGDSLWCNVYEDVVNSSGLSVEEASDGGFILVGYADWSSNYGPRIVRVNDVGEEISSWASTQYEVLQSVVRDSDGGFIAAGGSRIMRLDDMGDTAWIYHIDQDYPKILDVIQVDSGEYIVAGNNDYDICVAKIGPYLCGNADGSGLADIDDVVYLMNYILGGGPAPEHLEAGDADCSGGVDIDDVVWLIAYIFSGGNVPCDTDGDDVSDC